MKIWSYSLIVRSHNSVKFYREYVEYIITHYTHVKWRLHQPHIQAPHTGSHIHGTYVRLVLPHRGGMCISSWIGWEHIIWKTFCRIVDRTKCLTLKLFIVYKNIFQFSYNNITFHFSPNTGHHKTATDCSIPTPSIQTKLIYGLTNTQSIRYTLHQCPSIHVHTRSHAHRTYTYTYPGPRAAARTESCQYTWQDREQTHKAFCPSFLNAKN